MAAHVRAAIAEVMRPAHFLVSPRLDLAWEPGAEVEIPWEVFQGRLLDPAHTRERRSFRAWRVFSVETGRYSPEPALAVLWDEGGGLVHVTRAIDSYVWEGYHAGDNVYLSRETRKWVRELVGTIPLGQFRSAGTFRDELIGRVFQAIVGASRLPLTSVEAPLPAFSLGELAFFYRPAGAGGEAGPMRSFRELIDGAWRPELSALEKVKLLETVLRATPRADLPEAADLFLAAWRRHPGEKSLPALLRRLFDEVALSPYTDFVDRTLAFVRILVDRGGLTLEEQIDFLGYLLRQLGRHLTAYDLVTFHHQGANYPDMLLLDAVLKTFLRLLSQRPDLWWPTGGGGSEEVTRRLRRRALRTGYLLRRHYEGHPVPDAPTSPGENARVMPPPYARVPDEQIADPAKRARRLFADDPLDVHLGAEAVAILAESVRDLEHPAELRELGMAVFLDRPLGAFKRPAEPDLTPLLSYEAFSRAIARRRLGELERLAVGYDGQLLEALAVPGVAPPLPDRRPRPGAVSLADAWKVADDFVILRTTARSVRDFLAPFDFTPLTARVPLDFLTGDRPALIMRLDPGPGSESGLMVYDGSGQRRLELMINGGSGYAVRGGLEYPVEGLRAVRAWDADGRELSVDVAVPASAFPAG